MSSVCNRSKINKKVQIGNDQEKAQSERNSHSKNSKKGGGKTQIDNKVLILRKHIVSRVSSYFPIGDHSVIRT